MKTLSLVLGLCSGAAIAAPAVQSQLQNENRLIRSLNYTFEGAEKASALELISDNAKTVSICTPDNEMSKPCIDGLRVYVMTTQAKLATLLPSVCEGRVGVLQELLVSQRALRDRLDWDPGANTYYAVELLRALARVVARTHAPAEIGSKVAALIESAKVGDSALFHSDFVSEVKELGVLIATDIKETDFETQMLVESLKGYIGVTP